MRHHNHDCAARVAEAKAIIASHRTQKTCAKLAHVSNATVSAIMQGFCPSDITLDALRAASPKVEVEVNRLVRVEYETLAMIVHLLHQGVPEELLVDALASAISVPQRLADKVKHVARSIVRSAPEAVIAEARRLSETPEAIADVRAAVAAG